MDQLASQITQAVSFALNPDPQIPQEQRHEAYSFLQQVKDASNETWQACWNIFLSGNTDNAGTGGGGVGSNERMFALQVVSEALPSMTPEALAMLNTSMFDYFQREYVSGPAENGVAFLKNASVNLAAQVFVYTYPQIAPNFISSFLSLLRTHSTTTTTATGETDPSTAAAAASSQPLNPQTTDLVLRLLHEISLEIGDAQLRLNKSTQRLHKDTELRDAIRERDAATVAASVWDIIAEAIGAVENDRGGGGGDESGTGKGGGLRGKTARDVGEMAVRVAGDYVSWIDINLMVTPSTISLLLQSLNLASPFALSIRTATADTLIETVLKGMPAGDKLKLLQVLDVSTVLTALKDVGREGGKTEATTTDEEEGFRERLGKLLNGVGTELCKMLDESSTPDDAKVLATASLTPLLPLVIHFLSDSHIATSLSLHPFASQLLSLYKKQKRQAGAGQLMADPTMTLEKRAFLEQLLKAAVSKMAYSDDFEWEMPIDGEEDEEQLLFDELRKSLRTIGDGIAWIDPELYGSAIRTIVGETLDAFEASPVGSEDEVVPWQRIELALTLLYGFGQAISGQGPAAFVVVPVEELARAKREAQYHVNFNQFPLSPLGDLMLRACRSKRLASHRHAAVNLQFFETVVRYSEFFKLCPELIAELLPAFLDEHGLHQSESAVQNRVCYLFNRFIYQTRTIIQSSVSGDLVRGIFSGIQDLLVVSAELPDSEPPSEAVLTKAASSSNRLESQLYLFETVGTLIAILNQVPSDQVVLLNAVVDPLLNQLEQSVRPVAQSGQDFEAVLTSHHLIMAIGSVSKGFPDLSARQPTAQGEWVQVFRRATEGLLASAKIMAAFVVIRDAARFAFNRIVATTGQAVLDLIPTLIDCLISQVTFPELAELLSFLGLLVAKYKTNFTTILDTLLLPVFNRVFYFLQLGIAGTDDQVQHSALKRAYFGFIISICSANLQEVFYSEKNQPHLQSILQSIVHYISTDSLAQDQRYGFGVLVKLASIWVDPLSPLPTSTSPSSTTTTTTTTPATTTTAAASKSSEKSTLNGNGALVTPSPVPGFERFIYENVIGICFEIPLNPKFDFSDAQSFQVVGEIALLLKTLHQKRPLEFENFLESSFFPSMNCPADKSQLFLVALRESADGKQLKKFFGDWLKSFRG